MIFVIFLPDTKSAGPEVADGSGNCVIVSTRSYNSSTSLEAGTVFVVAAGYFLKFSKMVLTDRSLYTIMINVAVRDCREMQKWRNWQTRTVQVRVVAIP